MIFKFVSYIAFLKGHWKEHQRDEENGVEKGSDVEAQRQKTIARECERARGRDIFCLTSIVGKRKVEMDFF